MGWLTSIPAGGAVRCPGWEKIFSGGRIRCASFTPIPSEEGAKTMTRETSVNADREQRLHEVLAAYLEAVEAGYHPGQEEWLARHPDLAAELADFFANQEQVGQVAAPLRAVVQAAEAQGLPS